MKNLFLLNTGMDITKAQEMASKVDLLMKYHEAQIARDNATIQLTMYPALEKPEDTNSADMVEYEAREALRAKFGEALESANKVQEEACNTYTTMFGGSLIDFREEVMDNPHDRIIFTLLGTDSHYWPASLRIDATKKRAKLAKYSSLRKSADDEFFSLIREAGKLVAELRAYEWTENENKFSFVLSSGEEKYKELKDITKKILEIVKSPAENTIFHGANVGTVSTLAATFIRKCDGKDKDNGKLKDVTELDMVNQIALVLWKRMQVASPIVYKAPAQVETA